jgi:hypothetical protein
MSLRKTGLTGSYSASTAAGLAYASFAMTTVCSGHTVLHDDLTNGDHRFNWPSVYELLKH